MRSSSSRGRSRLTRWRGRDNDPVELRASYRRDGSLLAIRINTTVRGLVLGRFFTPFGLFEPQRVSID